MLFGFRWPRLPSAARVQRSDMNSLPIGFLVLGRFFCLGLVGLGFLLVEVRGRGILAGEVEVI